MEKQCYGSKVCHGAGKICCIHCLCANVLVHVKPVPTQQSKYISRVHQSVDVFRPKSVSEMSNGTLILRISH